MKAAQRTLRRAEDFELNQIFISAGWKEELNTRKKSNRARFVATTVLFQVSADLRTGHSCRSALIKERQNYNELIL